MAGPRPTVRRDDAEGANANQLKYRSQCDQLILTSIAISSAESERRHTHLENGDGRILARPSGSQLSSPLSPLSMSTI